MGRVAWLKKLGSAEGQRQSVEHMQERSHQQKADVYYVEEPASGSVALERHSDL